jgi:hypothetical protein
MKRLLGWGLLCALPAVCVLSALADGVAGKWTGTITPERTNPVAVQLELKVDGSTVTGKAGPEEHQFDVRDGKVDGDRVTFHVMGTGGADYAFNLLLEGDSLHGSVHLSRPEDGAEVNGKVELKRAH